MGSNKLIFGAVFNRFHEFIGDRNGDVEVVYLLVIGFAVDELDGGEVSDLVLSATNGTTINLPTPSKYGHVFLGWTLEQGSEEYIYSFKLTADTTVYANWIEATFYYINYELNGGSIKYASREELVQDFVNDYSSTLGKGYATAADTGSAIKNNKIDLYMDTHGEALSWGVKYVNLYILGE